MTILIRTCGPSNGAVALRDALRQRGVSVLISRRTRFRRGPFILNWGTRELLSVPDSAKLFNYSAAINIARDKLATFNKLKEQGFESIPDYWTEAPSDEERADSILLERRSLTGQGGAGIQVRRRGEPLSECPLYVRYIRKVREFRVHVFNGEAIAVQEKRRESEAEQTPDQKLIRNRDNGWVFCVLDIQEPEGLRSVAVDAVSKLGLDFGAVDMILGRDERLYVLEVNTRPGLESPTILSAYADAIQRVTNDRAATRN